VAASERVQAQAVSRPFLYPDPAVDALVVVQCRAARRGHQVTTRLGEGQWFWRVELAFIYPLPGQKRGPDFLSPECRRGPRTPNAAASHLAWVAISASALCGRSEARSSPKQTPPNGTTGPRRSAWVVRGSCPKKGESSTTLTATRSDATLTRLVTRSVGPWTGEVGPVLRLVRGRDRRALDKRT